ncbi:flagellar basal-body MS-ring/collar protein FliF [Vampirovibrio chlorellavorus]|uniref:flagellar basal-body MS-ring/collar protein FliF n=1 Tax=Vampirovibrio chlorellavorus TaxID=758823 RepID=UPI0026F19669|nr:flagellar basal-body MS-ring/collar protein FliF [Vampirovibrio chlorellavorus]
MNERINAIFSGFLQRWDQLSFNQRIMLGTLVVALMLSTFFVFQRTNDDYDILYDNMSLPDAAAAVEKLKALHEPYRIANGGHTLLVPRTKKNELVLATANELTSENTINLAKIPPVLQGDVQKEWIKKLNTQEIAGILNSIQGIKNAQVIVTQPEHTVFSDDELPVTASVMLMVEPGFRLHDEQVKVIKNLVSHAVPGLKAENVAIADNSGNPLVGPSSVMASGQSEADLRQKAYEDKITKKVLGILAPVVGKENAVVSVSAMLNFDQAESEINRVIPSGGNSENPTGLAVSQQSDVEEYSGGNKPKSEGGAPGVETNAAPSYQGETAKDKDSNYKRTKTTTNYTNSEERKKVIYAPGTVERLTVAVVLNKVLTAKETQEISELVQNAAGIDLSRGDSVDIKGFQFSSKLTDPEEAMTQAAKAAAQQSFYLQLASVGAMLILGMAAMFIFYTLFKKPAEGQIVDEPEEEYNYIAADDTATQLLEETSFAALETKMDPEVEHMKTSISDLITEDPAEATRVLMTYMKEL